MNNLSWFIYLAGVVEFLALWASIFATIGGLVYLAFIIVLNAMIGCCDPEADARDLREMRGVRRQISLVAIPILAVCIPLAFFVPSRQTMILIAGSEMGERIIKSDAMSDGMNLIKLWIKQETDKLNKAASK